ncbi:2-C-methyl-D-erythritol 2,4-cyclodiphosphate synthase [Candidatus Sumerlaeota bacterium]|nr:2-C-methyl-D-erythritol 2,4-cyclodiphosphate synthase [Candidatus Sumerlaeota bacterium]
MSLRIGQGFDVHRFAPGRPLVLGGVIFDHPEGLAGHSDADVVTHALCDALLGAAGLGDIGLLFPDTDPAYKGIDSLRLLAEVVQRVHEAGWRPVNADVTVICERPKIGPRRREMIAALESGFPDPVALSVKATTSEGLGFTGRGEGIAALAIALVESYAAE